MQCVFLLLFVRKSPSLVTFLSLVVMSIIFVTSFITIVIGSSIITATIITSTEILSLQFRPQDLVNQANRLRTPVPSLWQHGSASLPEYPYPLALSA